MRGQGVHAKALKIRAFWSEIGRTPGCPACETPGPGKSHTRECKTYQDAWDESRRTAPAEEANVEELLQTKGEDNVKFDVNEEAWPRADLAIHSSFEGALIDGLPADKVKAGDEREIKQMKDLQLYSWVKETDIPPDKSILLTGWARRLKGVK